MYIKNKNFFIIRFSFSRPKINICFYSSDKTCIVSFPDIINNSSWSSSWHLFISTICFYYTTYMSWDTSTSMSAEKYMYNVNKRHFKLWCVLKNINNRHIYFSAAIEGIVVNFDHLDHFDMLTRYMCIIYILQCNLSQI